MERVAALLRRLARSPGLRTIRQSELGERFADAFSYGRLVQETFRFVAREVTGRGAVAAYRPRKAKLDVVLRHSTSDRYIMAEVFRSDLYRLPPEVDVQLRNLGDDLSIVDLGAHIGLFGVFMLTHFPEAHILAYEADPANADVLERCVARNRAHDRWVVVRASAGTSEGVDAIASGLFAESHVVDAERGSVTVPRRDVFEDLPSADLIKMDIEGSEWPILGDPRLATLRAPVVALEYHPERCPFPDPRAAALRRFRELDYRVVEIEVPFAPPGVGMLWAWRDLAPETPAASLKRSA